MAWWRLVLIDTTCVTLSFPGCISAMRSNFHRRGGRFSSFTTTLLYCAQSRGFGYRILPFGSLLELMQIVTLPSAPELLSPATTETETGDWRQWHQDKLCQLLDLQLESFKCQGIKSFRIGWDGMQWSVEFIHVSTRVNMVYNSLKVRRVFFIVRMCHLAALMGLSHKPPKCWACDALNHYSIPSAMAKS